MSQEHTKNPKRRWAASQTHLENIENLYEEYDQWMFRQTMNDMFIMEGLCPDVPIAMRVGMMKINGVWQPGVLYSQYQEWEDYIDDIWDVIGTKNFGEVFFSKN